jgi:DNA-directed RNA polymerase specialized sigma24 family protein
MTTAVPAPRARESARDRARRDALLPAALEAARRGDERAFMLLYHWRAQAVAGCIRLGLTEPAVRATVREVFQKAWHALPQCRAQDAVEFDVWLLRELSAAVQARRGELATPADAPPVWDLPGALRETVLLRDAFGHGLDQVARALAQPVDTVRLWYRRGLESVAA